MNPSLIAFPRWREWRARRRWDKRRRDWYASWRQYVFYPNPDTIFNKGCLRDIARFCEEHHQVRA